MKKLPVFFQRDQDNETLLVMPKSLENLELLKVLARKSLFKIASYGEMIIVEQGEGGWYKALKKANSLAPKKLHMADKASFLTQGEESVSEVCDRCPRDPGECGGPLKQMPEYENGARDESGLSAMRKAVLRKTDCLIYNQSLAGWRGGIVQKQLRDLGLEPIGSPRAFVQGSLDEGDYDLLVELSSKADLGKFEEVKEHGGVHVNSWLHANDFAPRWSGSRATSIHDFMFDPKIVSANLMASKIRGGHAQAKKNMIADYRSKNCSQCVFDCEKTPWNLEEPKPLTHEMIMDEFRPSEEDLEWMKLFTVTGLKADFLSQESGRRRASISRRPDRKEMRIEIAACSPPYESIALLTVEEYFQEIEFLREIEPRKPSIEGCGEEERAYAHWALKSIDNLTRWNEARFYGNGRCQHNQILSIRMNRNCRHIDIESDTLASSWGGHWGSRGNSIKVSERPRFSTSYLYPFTHSIWHWFYDAPGACSGRKK